MHFLFNSPDHSNQLVYRLATFRDLPTIIQINQATLPENYPIQTWNYLLINGKIYCVEFLLTSEIIGYCVELPNPSNLPLVVQNWLDGQTNSLIYSIAIRKEWQGFQIGFHLLQTCLNFSNSSIVLLQVRKSNLHAQKLYLKLGFQYLLEQPNYYPTVFGSKENAYFMYWQNPKFSKV